MVAYRFPRIFALLLSSLVLAGLMVAFILISSGSAAGGEIFIVDSSGDSADSSMGDCACATSSGDCTLRAAIQEANACSGGQTIRFNSSMTIVPATALPVITGDYTVIDGSNQWYDWSGTMVPGVTLDGESLDAYGLTFNASHCAIYGLYIINFGQAGILVSNVAEDNHIGGEGENQRNVVTKNAQNGILIFGADAKNNVVSSNYVGTNVKGYYELDGGNGYHGVSVWYGEGNVITDNLIAFNKWSGATMDAVDSGIIANNRIGMDIGGGSLPNSYYGVHISNMAKPQIIGNEIAFNKRGILVAGGSQAIIDGNQIYQNNATSLDAPDGGGVLITGTLSQANLYQNTIYENTALYGGGVAVEDSAIGIVDHNIIQENDAVRSDAGNLGGGGIYVNSAVMTATYNTIISNTAEGPTSSVFGFPDGGGVYLFDAGDSRLNGNEIRGNQVIGNGGGGGGVMVLRGGNIRIENNTIYDNYVNTMSISGSGVHVNTELGPTKVYIEGNRVEENSTLSGGAINLYESYYVTLTNNLIINNSDPGLNIQDCGTFIQSNFNTIAMNSGSGTILNNSHLYLYNTLITLNSGYGVELIGMWGMTSTRNDVWGNRDGVSNIDTEFYLEVDPLFFNADERNFALRPESPVLDVGDDGHPVSTSYNGVTRPVGGGYDIGAYEMPLPTWLPVILR